MKKVTKKCIHSIMRYGSLIIAGVLFITLIIGAIVGGYYTKDVGGWNRKISMSSSATQVVECTTNVLEELEGATGHSAFIFKNASNDIESFKIIISNTRDRALILETLSPKTIAYSQGMADIRAQHSNMWFHFSDWYVLNHIPFILNLMFYFLSCLLSILVFLIMAIISWYISDNW